MALALLRLLLLQLLLVPISIHRPILLARFCVTPLLQTFSLLKPLLVSSKCHPNLNLELSSFVLLIYRDLVALTVLAHTTTLDKTLVDLGAP